jgi:hypothetical protein
MVMNGSGRGAARGIHLHSCSLTFIEDTGFYC